MIDLHSHLVPGVDDGAQTLEESRNALETLWEQGVRSLVTTPHLDGSLTEREEELAAFLAGIDAAWAELKALAERDFPALRIERGHEIMLNTPTVDASDPRVRMAGTSFVLVEFPYMTVPPNSVDAIFELRMKGWTPVIAHPERYTGVDSELAVVAEWKRVGAFLQVNEGSLLGRYGDKASSTAWRLLRRGWADYLSSDYHARGRCPVADAREKLAEKGGEEQIQLLMEENPARLLAGEIPHPVPPLVLPKKPWWRRWK